MKRHLDEISAYIDGDANTHVLNMKRSEKWATQAEIFAAASAYGIEIFVLTSISDSYKWLEFNPCVKRSDCYVTLCNTNGNHYDCIIRAKDKCNCELEKPVV